jgi:hypothetical protein
LIRQFIYFVFTSSINLPIEYIFLCSFYSALHENLENCVNGFNNVGEYIGEQSKEAEEHMHKTIEALQADIEQIEKFAATPSMKPLQPLPMTAHVDPSSTHRSHNIIS